ncbi:hypothetical protein [Desulfatiferula olefinivorans]
MKRIMIAGWGALAICMTLVVMAASASSAQPLDYNVLAGEWARLDGNYTLRVAHVMSDGTVDVFYFNPGEIHVAQSRVGTREGRVELFVKLQDKGYPDCTYTLFYYPEQNVLAGEYYQAAVDQTYEVVFVRK